LVRFLQQLGVAPLMGPRIKGYLGQKLKSELMIEDRAAIEGRRFSGNETSVGIELVAHMEHKRKGEVTRFLIDEGIQSYIEELKEGIKNEPRVRRLVSNTRTTRLIRELVKLSNKETDYSIPIKTSDTFQA
jgi:hypothetical protein